MSILRIVASFMRDYRLATPALPLQATPALSTHLRSLKSGGKGPSITYRPHHRDPVIGYAVPLTVGAKRAPPSPAGLCFKTPTCACEISGASAGLFGEDLPYASALSRTGYADGRASFPGVDEHVG